MIYAIIFVILITFYFSGTIVEQNNWISKFMFYQIWICIRLKYDEI